MHQEFWTKHSESTYSNHYKSFPIYHASCHQKTNHHTKCCVWGTLEIRLTRRTTRIKSNIGKESSFKIRCAKERTCLRSSVAFRRGYLEELPPQVPCVSGEYYYCHLGDLASPCPIGCYQGIVGNRVWTWISLGNAFFCEQDSTKLHWQFQLQAPPPNGWTPKKLKVYHLIGGSIYFFAIIANYPQFIHVHTSNPDVFTILHHHNPQAQQQQPQPHTFPDPSIPRCASTVRRSPSWNANLRNWRLPVDRLPEANVPRFWYGKDGGKPMIQEKSVTTMEFCGALSLTSPLFEHWELPLKGRTKT